MVVAVIAVGTPSRKTEEKFVVLVLRRHPKNTLLVLHPLKMQQKFHSDFGCTPRKLG